MRHGSRYNGATVYDGMIHDTPMHLSSAEAYWCYSAILSIWWKALSILEATIYIFDAWYRMVWWNEH